MKRIAIVGGGISGLSIAHCLKNEYKVKIFEKESVPGGLIRCDRINGVLYHQVGGHVFNSRRPEVLTWFWNFFNKEKEFTKTLRNASIFLDGNRWIGYPIENHMYMLDTDCLRNFIRDIIQIAHKEKTAPPQNFEDFLLQTFGNTLYDLYFKSYNEKIWRRDLKEVPLSWLEGKLPMPSIEEMIYNNVRQVKEMKMVHSTFYYAKNGGSQFIANRIASQLTIEYNSHVSSLEWRKDQWLVNGEEYNAVIFCGNLKELPLIIKGYDISQYNQAIEQLDYHGTTSVLCEVQHNPYSWIYMPSRQYKAHRIICTGNFASSNNTKGRNSATVEFTDCVSERDIYTNLSLLPLSPKYITHKYTKYTYPIQDTTTRKTINSLKEMLIKKRMYLLGRFAEWEYYNMDAAIGAALDLSEKIKTEV
ncbi:protoporphyrinogen/coproporphyrinogen oxidase [Tannerella forsythia]|uniref:FAD-dependent oxidoreductase n=1 Tax=Tannerella forsythia TaxID=28112 RepID=A0A3P1XU48_TANFO|nr:NAD(P)-binding protein [Tannerella forsythia]RRD61447.1 FAD-dependent oxidoreductase [Tannerella forsythia]